jgi:uncharacterized protein (DUF2141 family)
MKSLSLIFSFLCISYNCFTADITLLIKNIDEVKGDVAFAIYQEGDWLNEKKYSYSVREKVTGKTMKLIVKDVKPGTYGVAGYHDTNLSKNLDKNFIGMPKEQVGFSNGATIGLGAPDFDDAIIKVTEGGKNEFVIEFD